MGALFSWNVIAGALKWLLGGVFEFLNKRVDANLQMHISDNATTATVAGAQLTAQANADNINGNIRLKEGPWSPWVVVTILGFMVPFGFHTWQVVLDSCRWIPVIDFAFGFIPYPAIAEHTVGSWRVERLPGLFETTEHAVIQSLFIGAGVAVGGIAVIKAMRGR